VTGRHTGKVAAALLAIASVSSLPPSILQKRELLAAPEVYRTKGQKPRYRDLSSKRGKKRK
jgi:hypothetical protein